VFVDREAFEGLVEDQGFLEWAEFLGQLYGTPMPVPPRGSDVLLEIDLVGARQVVGRIPGARVILVVPPTEQHQIERLRTRGDTEEHVVARVERGREEIAAGRELAHYVVVNDDLETSVAELLSILGGLRDSRSTSDHQNEAP
jgi:guanylate kinase